MNTKFIKNAMLHGLASLFLITAFESKIHAQNDCSDAIVIPSIPYSSGVLSTCGTGDDFPAGSYGRSAFYGDGEDYVFQIDITTAPVSLNFTLGGSANWKILDINTACDPIAANSLGGCITTDIYTTNVANVTFPINGTYYIFVDTWTAADCGEFTLDINPTVPAPVNDLCTGAIDLSAGTSLISETTVGANEEVGVETCSGLTSNYGIDNWYYILSDDDGDLTISVSSATDDMVIEIYSGTCTVPLFEACVNDLAGPGDEELTIPASVGVTYFIRVYGMNNLSGTTYDIVALGTPLMIELANVSAMNIGQTNLIQWTTAKEAIGDAFIIERSKDGREFEALTSFQASGEAKDYQFIDNSPFFGTNFYRIKLVHDNGKISYSTIVSATIHDKNGNIILFPNPTSNMITVQFTTKPSDDAKIIITNLMGREIRVIDDIHSTNVELNVEDLPTGLYFIKYISNNTISFEKFIKE